MELYRRHRRKIWGAAVVGAAGAAAYAAYRWWYTEDSYADYLQRRAAAQGRRRTAEEEQEALQQHFASIQHIPEQKTLPTLLPSLQAALLRAVDTSPLKVELRRLKGESDAAMRTAKVEVWTELAQASFALAASAAWALPLLDLLLRVQINVLGRHLYFASLASDSPLLLEEAPPLSTAEQHTFLGYADTLAAQGVPQLVAAMRTSVRSVLQGLELSQPISAEHAMGLLADIHQEFETAARPGGWQTFLLPGDAEATTPQVAAMLAEVRSVVAGPQFALAIKTAVNQSAAALAEALAASIGSGEGLPLARVVPLTEAAAAALLLGPDNAVVSAIGRLPVVHDLCSAAYAGIAAA